mmetsp:Transcript_7855/g.15448  ORF Transcript_7855/g.15448 Transcript_7855/m.15448 type:complete len:348 (+) Transcript_7855:39-1082(+)
MRVLCAGPLSFLVLSAAASCAESFTSSALALAKGGALIVPACGTTRGSTLLGLRGGGRRGTSSNDWWDMSGKNKPMGFSAPPGTLDKEDQKVLTPLGESSYVLCVGATRGIGLKFVEKLLEKGCTVVGTHRGGDVPADLKSLADKSDKLKTLSMDVGDPASITAAAAKMQDIIKAEGSAGLTHIIHNAGIYGPRDSFDGQERNGRKGNPAVTSAGMLETFQINAVGPLLVAQAFTPLMCPPTKDAIPILSILTSKVGSVDDNTSGGAYAYRASKSALNNIAKSLHVDLYPRATVVLLHPGYVKTDMTGGQGLIETEESVDGMLRAVEATNAQTPFRFVDFKACRIPW